MWLPIPRDLKEPDGCRFSSLRKMRQPAALERAEDSTRGVAIQGLGIDLAARLPSSKRAIVFEYFLGI